MENMRLTESQLIGLIGRAVRSVLSEGYQDKQPREQSKEEHDEWVRRKSASKKAYYDSKRKESGEEGDSKDGAIDHYDYKHGKGNFPVMKEGTEVVRFTESQFNDFITEAVKRVIKETTLDYDMDNFSGRWSRGTRYDILVDGDVYYHDVPEESVDRLCSQLASWGYDDIQAKEI